MKIEFSCEINFLFNEKKIDEKSFSQYSRIYKEKNGNPNSIGMAQIEDISIIFLAYIQFRIVFLLLCRHTTICIYNEKEMKTREKLLKLINRNNGDFFLFSFFLEIWDQYQDC